MTCEQFFQAATTTLPLEMSFERREEMIKHFKECAECQERLEKNDDSIPEEVRAFNQAIGIACGKEHMKQRITRSN